MPTRPGFQEFPKMVYRVGWPLDDHAYVIVQNREEQDALGVGHFEKPDEASACFKGLPLPEQLQILSHARNPGEATDRLFQRRFEEADGDKKLAIVREYRDRCPHFAVNSEWAKPYLPHLPPAEMRLADSTQDSVVVAASRFTHSPDYGSVTLRGQPYSLTSRQAQFIQILHSAFESGNPAVRKDYILEQLGTSNSRWQDTFKTNPEARKALIRVGARRGTLRLNL